MLFLIFFEPTVAEKVRFEFPSFTSVNNIMGWFTTSPGLLKIAEFHLHEKIAEFHKAIRFKVLDSVMAGELGVLNALDVAKTQWYHFTAIVIAGMGFFTDAYDLFCISLVTKLLGRIYYTDITKPKPGILPASVQSAVVGVALCGTLAGHMMMLRI